MYVYLFGAQGMHRVRTLYDENQNIEKKIQQVEQEIIAYQKELQALQVDHFYQEKLAREQLQMARSGDEVYYLT